MTMFEITPYQLETLSSPINETFVIVVPDRKQDPEDRYTRWLKNSEEILELVHEGFIKDITDQCSDFIAQMKESSGREFRAYEMTKLAKDMFLNPKANALIH